MKVGEYIRTPYGIRKIVDIQKDDGYGKPKVKVIKLDDLLNTNHKYSYAFYTDEKVIKEAKSSPNIIDLIEVGDIVNYEQLNGGVVLNKKDDSIDTWSILPNSLKNEDIKSVITKEQLKNCMYEVGESDER